MLWGKMNPAVHKGDKECGARLGVVTLNGVIGLVFTEVVFVNRFDTSKDTSHVKYGERII